MSNAIPCPPAPRTKIPGRVVRLRFPSPPPSPEPSMEQAYVGHYIAA
jgi:hypothetical protein